MKYYNKLAFRITLTIFIPIFAIAIFVIIFMYNNFYNLAFEKYTNNLETVNRNYIDFIDDKLHSIEEEAIRKSYYFLEKNFDNKKDVLEFTKNNIKLDSVIFGSAVVFDIGKYKKNDDYAFFYSYKKDHEIAQICFEDESDIDFFDYRNNEQQWWDIPSSTYHSGWTEPYYDFGASKVDMITYYYPFFIDNEYQGVITIDISLETLRGKLIKNKHSLEEKLSSDLYILSFDSIIIYTKYLEESGKNIYQFKDSTNRRFDLKESSEILERSLNRKTGMMDLHSYEGDTMYLAFYSPFNYTNWTAINLIPYHVIYQNVYEQMELSIYIITLFVIFLTIIIFLIASYISKPIVRLSNYSLRIAEGNYDAKPYLTGKTEIGVLSRNFAKMQKEVKHREKLIRQKNKQLLKLDIAKNNFLLLISHEIRTPLNGIAGATFILNDMIEDPELIEFIKMLEESVNRLDKFLTKALEITHMQTVGDEIEKTDIQICPIINHALKSFSSTIDNKSLHLITNFSEDCTIKAVDSYFIHVIEELISNAIKFSYEKTDIIIDVIKQDKTLILKISNMGKTIPKHKKSEITKPFGLAHEHIDRNIGLGLNYVQTFVDLHHAKLKIVSENEKTTVSIHFNI